MGKSFLGKRQPPRIEKNKSRIGWTSSFKAARPAAGAAMAPTLLRKSMATPPMHASSSKAEITKTINGKLYKRVGGGWVPAGGGRSQLNMRGPPVLTRSNSLRGHSAPGSLTSFSDDPHQLRNRFSGGPHQLPNINRNPTNRFRRNSR